MPEQNTTRLPENAGSEDEPVPFPAYHLGDEIVFKYEGNLRARVTGHKVMGGKVWVEAQATNIEFLIPVCQVIGVEPKEEE
jgi:hypothetical protein